MRIVVDPGLCEANGVCVQIAAKEFRLDDRDQLHVLVDRVPAERLEVVRLAVQRCPKQALRLSED